MWQRICEEFSYLYRLLRDYWEDLFVFAIVATVLGLVVLFIIMMLVSGLDIESDTTKLIRIESQVQELRKEIRGLKEQLRKRDKNGNRVSNE